MTKETKEKIRNFLDGQDIYKLAGYVALTVRQTPSDSLLDNINTIIDYLENGYLGRGWANGKERRKASFHFLDVFDEYGEAGFRVCDNCGQIICEGYILGGNEYACSDECAIDLYDGDEDAFRTDLEDADTDDGETYWTEW